MEVRDLLSVAASSGDDAHHHWPALMALNGQDDSRNGHHCRS
jgi:hypothetical protein